MKKQNLLAREKEVEEDAAWERQMLDSTVFKPTIDQEKKERERVKKRNWTEQKKKEDIPLLEFTRQVVDLTVQNHSETTAIVSQKQATARLTPGTLAEVRYDSGRHLIKLTTTTGVCKEYRETTGNQKRTLYRCDRCDVALHPNCFFNFHVPVEDRK
jgi:hypothetical protein